MFSGKHISLLIRFFLSSERQNKVLSSVSFAAFCRVQHRRSLCYAGGEKQNEPMTLMTRHAILGRHANLPETRITHRVESHISPPCGHLSYLRRGLITCISGQTRRSAQNIFYTLNFTLYTLNIEQASENQTCLNFCNERRRYSTKLNH